MQVEPEEEALNEAPDRANEDDPDRFSGLFHPPLLLGISGFCSLCVVDREGPGVMDAEVAAKGRRDMKPLLLKLGVALAVSVAGFLVSQMRPRARGRQSDERGRFCPLLLISF